MNNKRLQQAAIGVCFILIFSTLFYVDFLRKYLLWRAGEIETFRYSIRSLITPLFIVFGLALLLVRPTYQVFAPWKKLDATGKKFILITGVIGVCITALIFIWWEYQQLSASTSAIDTECYETVVNDPIWGAAIVTNIQNIESILDTRTVAPSQQQSTLDTLKMSCYGYQNRPAEYADYLSKYKDILLGTTRSN